MAATTDSLSILTLGGGGGGGGGGGTNNTTANYRLLATAPDKSLGYTLRAHDNCKTSLRYTSLPRRAAASLAVATAQNTEYEVVKARYDDVN